MHRVPAPPPRPQEGRPYVCSRILRFEMSMALPITGLIVQVSPRLRETKKCRPPNRIVFGLCGEIRIGEFQLNCMSWSAGSSLRMLEPPPPRPPPPPPAAPPAPPIRGRMLVVVPVFRSYRLMFPFCDSV